VIILSLIAHRRHHLREAVSTVVGMYRTSLYLDRVLAFSSSTTTTQSTEITGTLPVWTDAIAQPRRSLKKGAMVVGKPSLESTCRLADRVVCPSYRQTRPTTRSPTPATTNLLIPCHLSLHRFNTEVPAANQP
jgi:hypothetical protein